MKRENEYLLLFIFLVVVLFAFAYRNFLGSGVFAYGDLIPFPTSSADAYKLFFSAWGPKSMGSVEAEPFSTFILGFLLLISGNNAVFIQKLVFLSLLPVSAITMYIFLGHFIKSQPARFIASFLYSVNRMTIGEFISMSISTMSIYALLPLILLFSLKIFEEEKTSSKIRNVMMLIIFSSLTFGNSLQVVYAILIPVIAIFFLLYLSLSHAKLRYVLIVIPLFLVSFLFSHLLLQMFSPWYFGLWFPKEGILHTLPMEFQIYNLINCYTYPPTTIANLFRLAWAEYIHGILYIGVYPDFTSLGFVIPLLAFSSLLFRKNRKYSIGFAITAVSIILFLWLTYLRITHDLFLMYPILFIYRFPSKLLFTLSLVYAPMIATTIEGTLTKLKETRLVLVNGNRPRIGSISVPLLLCIILVSSVALYDWPFFTGDMGISRVWGNDYVIPSPYYNATSWTNNHRESEGFFRTLWLPWDHVTELRLWRLDPYTFSVPVGGALYGFSSFPYFKSVFYSIVNQRTSTLGTLIGPANVKYVVVDFAVRSRERGGTGEVSLGGSPDSPFALGSPEGYVSILNYQKDLEKVADITRLTTPTKIGWLDKNFTSGWVVNSQIGGSLYNATTDGEIYKISVKAGGSLALSYMTKNVSINTNDYPYFMVKCKIGETGGKALVSVHYNDKTSTDNIYSNTYYVTHKISLPQEKTVDYVLLGFSNTQSSINTTYSAYYDAVYFNNDGSIGEYSNIDFVIYENKAFVPHIAVYDEAFLVVATPSDPLYNPSFPEMTFPSHVSSLASLSSIPNFNVNGQLLVFQDNLTASELPLESYEAFVFIDNQRITGNIGSQKLVFIYEADRDSVTKVGNWAVLERASASGGHAIIFSGEGIALSNFTAPRSGSYKIALRALTNENIHLMIDSASLQLKQVATDKGLNWYETNSSILEFGPHQVSATLHDSDILDQIVVFSSDVDKTIGEIFRSNSTSTLFSSNMIAPTDYQIDLNASKQVFIVLGESYHQDWHAFAGDEELVHVKAFSYSNAFLLSKTGENKVRISFEEQKTRDFIIGISAVSWISLLACAAYTSEKVRNFRKLINRLYRVKKH